MVVTALNLLVVPIAQMFRASLGRLGDARFQRNQVEAIAARPLPSGGAPVPASLYYPVPSAQAALGQLMARVRSAASATSLPVPQIEPFPVGTGASQVVAIRVVIAGKETGVVAFIGRIEQDRPLARFTSWRIARTAKGAVRLDGVLAAAWGQA